MPVIEIATDGSCIQPGGWRDGDPRPRPGAAAFVLERRDGSLVRFAVPEADTTIGRMEMIALASALEYVLAQPVEPALSYRILCDSQFVVNGANEWLAGWAAKNFTKKGGLANADVWRRIHLVKGRLANAGVAVVIQWVKGHNGDRLNGIVDEIANTCARTQAAIDERGPTTVAHVIPTITANLDDTAFDTPVDAARNAWIAYLAKHEPLDNDRTAAIIDGQEDDNDFINGFLAGRNSHAG